MEGSNGAHGYSALSKSTPECPDSGDGTSYLGLVVVLTVERDGSGGSSATRERFVEGEAKPSYQTPAYSGT